METKYRESENGDYLVVQNMGQAVVYDEELTGQISDGHWENMNPSDHWHYACELGIIIDTEAEQCYVRSHFSHAAASVPTFLGLSSKSTSSYAVTDRAPYKFESNELFQVVGDRIAMLYYIGGEIASDCPEMDIEDVRKISRIVGVMYGGLGLSDGPYPYNGGAESVYPRSNKGWAKQQKDVMSTLLGRFTNSEENWDERTFKHLASISDILTKYSHCYGTPRGTDNHERLWQAVDFLTDGVQQVEETGYAPVKKMLTELKKGLTLYTTDVVEEEIAS